MSILPSEWLSIGRIVSIGDGEPQEDVAVWLILLHIHCVVSLSKDWRVVVGILNVSVDEDRPRGKDRAALVHYLDLQN